MPHGPHGDFCREMSALTDSLLKLCQHREQTLVQAAGITSVELRTLQLLESGRHTMRELAKALDLSPSRVTRVADSLEGKGLLQREQQLDDRRFCPVSLTKRGAEASQQGERVLHDFQEQVAGGLTEGEQEMIIQALHRFLSAFQRGQAGC
jgi:DNA-binding MarR family transcriptional regulator